MNILFILDSTEASDELRWVKALCEHLPMRGIMPRVVFASDGMPTDITYQSMLPFPVPSLSFKANKQDWIDKLSRYIEDNKVRYIVVSQAWFGEHFIGKAIENTGVRVVFVAQRCTEETSQSVSVLMRYNPTWLAPSQTIASYFLKDIQATVVYPCVSKPKRNDNIDIRTNFGIPPSKTICGFIGEANDFLAYHELIEAASIIEAYLIFVVRGPKIGEIQEYAKPLKVIPFVPEYRANWYELFDVFCYPVRGAGFPVYPIEALLCGTPVTMTPVGDMSRLFSDLIAFHDLSPSRIANAIEEAKRKDISYAEARIMAHLNEGNMLDRFIGALPDK